MRGSVRWSARPRDAAIVALAHTPSQLAVLAEAGVVDAGGFGLVVILDALCAVVTGEPTGLRPPLDPATRPDIDPGGDAKTASDHLGYEVQYILRAPASALDELRTDLARLGDSVDRGRHRVEPVERPRPCRRRRRRDRGGPAGRAFPSEIRVTRLGASEAYRPSGPGRARRCWSSWTGRNCRGLFHHVAAGVVVIDAGSDRAEGGCGPVGGRHPGGAERVRWHRAGDVWSCRPTGC